MPVTVIVGGQFGSEGKGKVAHLLAQSTSAAYAIRVGGPNSGHTVVTDAGQRVVLRQLPTPALSSTTVSLLPAGSYIDLDILKKEIALVGLTSSRLRIHPNANVIRASYLEDEHASKLNVRIGSTETGVGAAVRARVSRDSSVLMARDCPDLAPYIEDFNEELTRGLRDGLRVMLEGTQGFGLSVLHASSFPYVTSRDTTAAGFISEAGISPLHVDDIVLVIRSFPIRVPGNSGPLPCETTWEEVSDYSGTGARGLAEYTSVTQRLRRVARFDAAIVKQAIAYNCPTRIVLNHLDYIDRYAASSLTSRAWEFVSMVEASIGQSIDLLGTSPSALINRAPVSVKSHALA